MDNKKLLRIMIGGNQLINEKKKKKIKEKNGKSDYKRSRRWIISKQMKYFRENYAKEKL